MTSFATAEGVPVGLAERIRPFTPLLLLVLLTTGVSIAEPGFASLETAPVVIADASVLFLLAAGLTFVIMLGEIDLSVQAAASFAGSIVAELLLRVG